MKQEIALFKIAHISDLHFSKISFGLSQFFSKKFIGNLNLLLHRSRIYKNERPSTLIDSFKKEGISHVLITGDLSTTSCKQEFQKAQDFMQALQKENIQVIVIPGNHDTYTQTAFKEKLFYQYIYEKEAPLLGYSLRSHQVCATFLGQDFWVVRIDSTYPAPLCFSTGRYTKTHDERLRQLLSEIPADHSIILMNHFPLFHYEHPRRIMYGVEMLRETIKLHPNIKFYLHGHTHKQAITDLRSHQLPIISDSGSVSHIDKGSWNCLTLYPSQCSIELFHPTKELGWASQKHLSYTW